MWWSSIYYCLWLVLARRNISSWRKAITAGLKIALESLSPKSKKAWREPTLVENLGRECSKETGLWQFQLRLEIWTSATVSIYTPSTTPTFSSTERSSQIWPWMNPFHSRPFSMSLWSKPEDCLKSASQWRVLSVKIW